jgi:multidrug resistance protein, MATE family
VNLPSPTLAAAQPAGRMASLRRIAPLAWPVFIGQVAVLAFGTVDTMLVARRSADDLAGLAVGGAAYVTVFVGLMGVVLAIGPIAGQLFGARRLGLSVIGSLVLLFPAPFLALANADEAVASKARGYLTALAVALPAVLAFQAMRGFNLAVSRPKAVMLLQLAGLALKIPLTIVLVPSLGVAGCGIATAVAMWLQLLAAVWVMRRDRFYLPFELKRRGPDLASQRALLRLGVPIGLSILIEVTGFSFMALFIARLGAVPVAGHQIAINIVSMMFMLPLAIANATSTLVAQQIGADDLRDARRIGWHGLQIGIGVSALLALAVFVTRESVIGLYTQQAAIAAAALPLIAWLVLFHTADAAQTLAAFVLRAYRITVVPLVIYVSALWGVGLGGGTWLAFGAAGIDALRGARGYWAAATLGVVLAAAALVAFMAFTLRRSGHLRQREQVAHKPIA